MTLTFFLFIGIILIFFVTLNTRPLLNLLGEDNFLISKLKNAVWFQNYWLAGMFLFIMNALLFY